MYADYVLWTDHLLSRRLPLYDRVCGDEELLKCLVGRAVSWARSGIKKYKSVAFVASLKEPVTENDSEDGDDREMWAPADTLALILRYEDISKEGEDEEMAWVAKTLMFTRQSQVCEDRGPHQTAEEHLRVEFVHRDGKFDIPRPWEVKCLPF